MAKIFDKGGEDMWKQIRRIYEDVSRKSKDELEGILIGMPSISLNLSILL